MSDAALNSTFELTDEDVRLLNSKIGLRQLIRSSKVDLRKALEYTRYDVKLKDLQAEMIKLQTWVMENGKKLVIVYEGRDAAGKGGAIRRTTAHINPRAYRVVALPKPTIEEAGQWYFQRYVRRLPIPGEIVFFDRSWYNRAVVEPVNGFCTQEQYNIFMENVNEFEKMLVQGDTYLIKMYFSITKEEQARRFADIKKDPLKRWKMSPVDERAQELWDEYTKYKQRMFDVTNTALCPWTIIDANVKTEARITSLEHILNTVPYQ
ncbi:MAG: polyphosphate kinase 2 [Bacteroidetes bacterium]|nr:MAG: polyphosphate kinase 2 [Bacteroidota bacterium]